MIRTLRRKFIGITMLSVTLVLLVLMTLINAINYSNVANSADAILAIIAENGGHFAETSEDSEEPPEPKGEEPKENLQEQSSDRNSDKSQGKGKFFRTPISEETPFNTRYFSVTLLSDGTVYTVSTDRISAIDTEQAQDYATGLYAQGKTSGFADSYRYLAQDTVNGNNEDCIQYIFVDCNSDLISFENFLIASILISLLGILAVFILVMWLSRIAVRPIAESYEKQKRFITDASHEIKTPLAIIDANVEVLEADTGENDWTKSIHHQIHRLTGLTEKLVMLSKMDEESPNLNLTDLDFTELLTEVCRSFDAVAEQKKLTYEYEIGQDLKGKADEKAMVQLFSLLLDNAMKYSDGIIRVTASGDKGLKVVLYNTASNLAQGNQDVLFERFYRPDASRTSKTGGYGIGMSVAQAIVNAHHGKISAESTDGKSLTITVLL